jgi:hypothetical protein
MRTKQPTIEDIYMADAFMTTPGIRQGLLERASEGNDDEVMTEDTDDGPVVYYRAPHGEMYPVGRPIMLAAGPSGTRTDAPAGATISPTPRNPVVGGVADFVRGVRDMANQYEIKDWVPLLGKMGVGDLLLGKSPEEIENWAYGNSPIAMPPSGTGGFVPVVKTGRKESLADTVFLGVDAAGLAKGAGAIGRGAVKGAARAIDQAMVEGTGPAARLIPDAMRPMNVVPPGPSAAPARAAAPVSDMGFYSAVEQAALNTQRKSGPGQAFLNDILKGENVKADEVKWIGLDEFLKGKKNVTREEVQQFIAANKVDVREVALGGADNTFTDPQKAIAYVAEREGMTPQQVMDNWGYTDQRDYLTLANDMAQLDPVNGSLPAKFGGYTLPGGQNYREILLTLPRSNFEKPGPGGQVPFSDAFRSTHWDQENVLAHIRVNDRVDADGKKMLLIEEVQSDWHQAGRDKGYIPKDISAVELKATVNNSADQPYYEVRTASGQFVANILDVPVEAGNEARAVTEAQRFLRNRGIPGAVPDAPMKDTWYQLALKRALKYAADNGYERVGLTTGKRQVERYPEAMRQIADEIVWDSYVGGGKAITVKKNGGNVFGAEIDKNGVIVRSNVSKAVGKPLNEVIGKSMADKAINAPSGEIKGTDFTVGGEGMKKYYDEVYPQFLAKYGKKWDAKVGQTTVQADGAEPVRYIDITPQMRESVGKGQPLFTAVPAGTAAGAATMQDKEQK